MVQPVLENITNKIINYLTYVFFLTYKLMINLKKQLTIRRN